jgi:hypothetical protein
LDKHCKRVYSKKIVLGLNDIVLKSIINKNIAFRVFGLTIEQLSMLYGVFILVLGTALALWSRQTSDLGDNQTMFGYAAILLFLAFLILLFSFSSFIFDKKFFMYIVFFFIFSLVVLTVPYLVWIISYSRDLITYVVLIFIVSVFYIVNYLKWLRSDNLTLIKGLWIPIFIFFSLLLLLFFFPRSFSSWF